jgi:phage gpG-like protein
MANFTKSINFSYARDNLLRDVARMAGVESVKFFKEIFRKGGFTDNSFQKWADKQSPLGGKKLMYNRGTLMQSIKKTEESNKRVVVSSDTPYSEIHNEGGYVVVTAQMKKYFWALYYRASGRITKTKSGKEAKTKKNATNNKKSRLLQAYGVDESWQ